MNSSKAIFFLSAGLLLLGYLAVSKSGNDGLNPNNPYPLEPERWRACLASGQCKASDMSGASGLATPEPTQTPRYATPTPEPVMRQALPPSDWRPAAPARAVRYREPREVGGYERPDR